MMKEIKQIRVIAVLSLYLKPEIEYLPPEYYITNLIVLVSQTFKRNDPNQYLTDDGKKRLVKMYEIFDKEKKTINSLKKRGYTLTDFYDMKEKDIIFRNAIYDEFSKEFARELTFKKLLGE